MKRYPIRGGTTRRHASRVQPLSTIRKCGCMRSLIGGILAAGCVIGLAIAGLAQQVADPDFDTKVASPAYTKKHPRVFLDEAHNNFHTASGRYKPFADLIGSDGYQVTPNKQKHMARAALSYVQQANLVDRMLRFDVVTISSAGVRHYRDAFQVDDDLYY